MRTTVNISLPKSMKDWIDRRVADDGYGTVSEYIRQLVREAQQRRQRAAIDANLLDALASGPAKPMTDKDWRDIRRKVRDRLTKRKTR